MSSAALAWNTAPPISTLNPETLIAPFDETVLDGGFLRVGQKTLRRGRELGITATEDMMRLKIEAHRYTKERLPYLSISFISGLIGKSYSTTQRYIKRLRQKGFLCVYTKDWDLAGEMPNGLSCYYYDFTPFYAQLQALEQEAPPENAEERTYRARLAEARHKKRILQEQAERQQEQIEAHKERSRLQLLETQRRLLLAEQKCQVARLEAQIASVHVETLETQVLPPIQVGPFQEGSNSPNLPCIAFLHSDVESKVTGIEEDRMTICFQRDIDSDSSGEAASFDKEEVDVSTLTYSHIAHGTIRKDKQEKTSTSHLTLVPASRISNPSRPSQEQGGARRSKEAKKKNTSGNSTKWQEMALAHGVSLEQQDALERYMRECPRPMHVPTLVELHIDPLSRSYNNEHLLLSNRTHATKLWQYTRSQGMDHEAVQDAFPLWVSAASSRVYPDVQNKMAWFFKALRLEVLKTVCAYEQAEMSVQNEPDSLTEAVSEEPLTNAQTNNTTCQEDEPRTGEQVPSVRDEEAINQEQDALSVSTGDEQECQEQPVPELEPEYLMNEDPNAGWATWANATYWADRLHEWVREDGYSVDVLPTRFGRWGFYLYKRETPELVCTYVEASAVATRIEEVKRQRFD